MRKSRSIAGAIAGVALLATGCGTTEQPVAGASTSSASTSASSASASADTSTPGGPITVTDLRGKQITLAAPAVRVAATEWNVAEYLVELGVQPVAVSDIAGYRTWSSAAPLDGTQVDLGTRGEPSVDTLAGLDLDLLLVTDALADGALEQIEGKIPVIVVPGGDATDPIGAMWMNVDLVATATGRAAQAATLKSDFEAVVANGRSAVAAAGAAGQPVAFSDAYDTGGSIYIRPYGPGSLVGAVLGELGLPSAWRDIEFDAAYGLGQTDVEGLTALGDARFWYIANDSSPDPYTVGLAGNAIWTSLPFVTSGKLQRFPDSIWMFGGPSSMTQIVDAAVAALG